MKSIRNLIKGNKYIVIKEFIDYDKIVHPLNEIWTFDRLSYVAYHDGVCLHVIKDDQPDMYRLMDIDDEQKPIIDYFLDYVKEV